MKARPCLLLVGCVVIGCGGASDEEPIVDSSGAEASTGAPVATSGETSGGAASASSSGDAPADGSSSDGSVAGSSSTGEEVPPDQALEVRFLGVGGFSFRYGDDLVLTAPMYSNPDFFAVEFGDIAADPARVDAFLTDDFLADASAILVGHAHYDHLLDVPLVWAKAPDAVVLGNTSVRHLMLAAGMPDASMVALDDPTTAWTDRRMCDYDDVCTGLAAGNEGAWFEVPGAAVRTRALCSSHPDQIFGVAHFAQGCIDAVPATLPTKANQWLEGGTLAYLVDFFAPGRDVPSFRVYVQDAPTNAPIGHPHPDLLAEKRIDVAVVNVGSWETVENHPTAVIEAVSPRYVVAGHWEDFFTPQDQPTMPIPFQADPAMFDEAALAALSEDDQAPFFVDGVATEGRYSRPEPGTDLVFAAE